MLNLAIGLIIAGLLVGFGAFAFAGLNMGRHVSRTFSGKQNFDQSFNSFGGMFGRHIGALIGMGAGGLMSVIGIILLILTLLGNAGLM